MGNCEHTEGIKQRELYYEFMKAKKQDYLHNNIITELKKEDKEVNLASLLRNIKMQKQLNGNNVHTKHFIQQCPKCHSSYKQGGKSYIDIYDFLEQKIEEKIKYSLDCQQGSNRNFAHLNGECLEVEGQYISQSNSFEQSPNQQTANANNRDTASSQHTIMSRSLMQKQNPMNSQQSDYNQQLYEQQQRQQYQTPQMEKNKIRKRSSFTEISIQPSSELPKIVVNEFQLMAEQDQANQLGKKLMVQQSLKISDDTNQLSKVDNTINFDQKNYQRVQQSQEDINQALKQQQLLFSNINQYPEQMPPTEEINQQTQQEQNLLLDRHTNQKAQYQQHKQALNDTPFTKKQQKLEVKQDEQQLFQYERPLILEPNNQELQKNHKYIQNQNLLQMSEKQQIKKTQQIQNLEAPGNLNEIQQSASNNKGKRKIFDLTQSQKEYLQQYQQLQDQQKNQIEQYNNNKNYYSDRKEPEPMARNGQNMQQNIQFQSQKYQNNANNLQINQSEIEQSQVYSNTIKNQQLSQPFQMGDDNQQIPWQQQAIVNNVNDDLTRKTREGGNLINSGVTEPIQPRLEAYFNNYSSNQEANIQNTIINSEILYKQKNEEGLSQAEQIERGATASFSQNSNQNKKAVSESNQINSGGGGEASVCVSIQDIPNDEMDLLLKDNLDAEFLIYSTKLEQLFRKIQYIHFLSKLDRQKPGKMALDAATGALQNQLQQEQQQSSQIVNDINELTTSRNLLLRFRQQQERQQIQFKFIFTAVSPSSDPENQVTIIEKTTGYRILAQMFNSSEDFYLNLLHCKQIGLDIEDNTCSYVSSDSYSYIIYYDYGYCTLKEYAEGKAWNEMEILFLLKRLLEIAFLVYNKQYMNKEWSKIEDIVLKQSSQQTDALDICIMYGANTTILQSLQSLGGEAPNQKKGANQPTTKLPQFQQRILSTFLNNLLFIQKTVQQLHTEYLQKLENSQGIQTFCAVSTDSYQPILQNHQAFTTQLTDFLNMLHKEGIKQAILQNKQQSDVDCQHYAQELITRIKQQGNFFMQLELKHLPKSILTRSSRSKMQFQLQSKQLPQQQQLSQAQLQANQLKDQQNNFYDLINKINCCISLEIVNLDILNQLKKSESKQLNNSNIILFKTMQYRLAVVSQPTSHFQQQLMQYQQGQKQQQDKNQLLQALKVVIEEYLPQILSWNTIYKAIAFGIIGSGYEKYDFTNEAEDYYNKSLEVYRKIRSNSNIINSSSKNNSNILNNNSNVLNNNSNVLNNSNSNNVQYEIRQLWRMMKLYRKQQRYQQSIDYSVQLLELVQTSYQKMHPFVGYLNFKLGKIYFEVNQYPQALKQFEKAVEIEKATEFETNLSLLPKYQRMLTETQLYLEQEPAAIKFCEEQIQLRQSSNNENQMIEMVPFQCSLGLIYTKKRNLLAAEVVLKQALQIIVKHFGQSSLPTTVIYGYLSLVAEQNRQFELAEAYTLLIIEIDSLNCRDQNIKYLAKRLNNLGSFNYGMNKLDEALKYYQQAVQLWENSKNQYLLLFANTCNNLGFAYHHQGDLQHAIEYYQSAVTALTTLLGENHVILIKSLINLASAQLMTGQLNPAETTSQKILKLVTENYDSKNQNFIICYELLGMISEEKQQIKQAEQYYQKALTVEAKIGGKESQVYKKINGRITNMKNKKK